MNETYAIQNISGLSFKNGTYWFQGLWIGALVGTALATILFFSAKDDPETKGHPNINFPKGIVFYLAIPSTGLGALFGALTPKTDDYNFKSLSIVRKRELLRRAFKKHKR